MLSKHHNDVHTHLKICVQSVYIGVTIDDKLSSDAQGGSNMNGDNQQILREIVLNPTIHGKELESIFGLSRRQLGYRIQKSIW